MSSLLNRACISGTTFIRFRRCLNSHLLKVRCYTKPPDTHGAQHFKKPPLTSCKDSPDSHSQDRDDHRTHRRALHKTQCPSENGAHERSKQESRGPHDGDQGPHEGDQGPRDEGHQGPSDEGHQGPSDEGHQGPHDKHHKDISKQTHLYKILGIKPTASHAQIKAAYFKKSKMYHPDVNQTEEAAVKFKEVQDAYKVLSNPAQRKVYDRHIPYEFNRKKLTDDDFTDMEQYFIKTYITNHRPQYGRTEYYKYKKRHKDMRKEAMQRSIECYYIQMEFERRQRLREKAKKANQFYTGTDFADATLPGAKAFVILFLVMTFGIISFGFIEEQMRRRRRKQERRKARLA